MFLKLTKRDGRALYVDTGRVLLVEQRKNGWWITVEALALDEPGGPGSGMRGPEVTSRVIDLDDAGAAPLLDHIARCHRACGGP